VVVVVVVVVVGVVGALFDACYGAMCNDENTIVNIDAYYYSFICLHPNIVSLGLGLSRGTT